jgi:hypothetical protein
VSFHEDSRLCRPVTPSSRLIHPRDRHQSNKRNAAFSFFSHERGHSPVFSVSLMGAEVIFEPLICVFWPYLGIQKIDKRTNGPK